MAEEEKLSAKETAEKVEGLRLDNEKKRIENEIARWKALVPDLSSVRTSETSVPADRVSGASMLTYRAMENAAAKVAAKIGKIIPKDRTDTAKILVTSEVDLASAVGSCRDVMQLIDRAKNLADALVASDDASGEPVEGYSLADPVTFAVGAAVASALPGLISLFRVQRTISFAMSGPNDAAAAALIAGKLLDGPHDPVHADFRILREGEGAVATKLDGLSESRIKLVKARSSAGKPPDGSPLARRLADIEAAISAIDALQTTLRSIPSGARRSAVTAAELYAGLLPEASKNTRLHYALLVKSEGGQSQQIFEQRTGPDTVLVVADSAITYMLLDTEFNRLVAAGTISGLARGEGTLGDRPRFEILSEP